jgi:hypothetical protein
MQTSRVGIALLESSKRLSQVVFQRLLIKAIESLTKFDAEICVRLRISYERVNCIPP